MIGSYLSNAAVEMRNELQESARGRVVRGAPCGESVNRDGRAGNRLQGTAVHGGRHRAPRLGATCSVPQSNKQEPEQACRG